MALRALAFLLCFLVASVSGAAVETAKHRPVSKVLTLLKDMTKQLEKEAVEDEKVFEEFGCWCETGLKSKTLAISTAQQNIATLRTTIKELASSAARLNTEIGTLNKEIAANTEALEQATAMREKELAEFSTEEKESLSTISSLGGAVGALAKHSGGAFLQVSASQAEFQSMEQEAAVTAIFRRHRHTLPEAQRKIVDAFLAAPGSVFGSAAADHVALIQQGASSEYNPAHAPQSGAITGVLKSMKENFETNLASSQKEETRSQADYDGLKKAKTSEIAAGNSLADTKSVELADTEQRHAQSDTDLVDTERTLIADQAYLKNLKEKCSVIDQEYEERTKTRQLEITAVSKALAYLSSDDASDLFSRTLNPTSFLQLSARIPIGEQVRPGDGAPVDGAGDDEQGLNQAEAAKSQGSAIAQVEKSVGDMVDELTAQKEEDDKLKDFCIDNLQSNERDLDEKHRERKNYEAAIADHEAKIKKLEREIEELHAEIHSSRVSLKRATEDREKMNSDFQTTVADQRATRNLLQGALSILKGFYDKSALIQAANEPPLIVVKPHPEPPLIMIQPALIEQPAGPPPPTGFKKAAPNSQSGGVMGMIEQIVKDADAMVEEALKGEEEAQKAYESLVGETNASIVAMQKSIVKKTEIKAQEEADKAQKKVELEGVMEEIAELDKALIDLHKQCDFHLKNYDKINEARDTEIHALKEAMALVAGQKYAQAQKTAAGVAP